jgi:hypothetical protein
MVALTVTPHATHSSLATARLPNPPGHTAITNAAAPTSTTSPVKSRNRAVANAIPTTRLPLPPASRSSATALAAVPVSLPTPKVKAPLTGWESAETTRQPTA